MKATWTSNAAQVRQRFDAAVPEGLRIVATAYQHHVKLGLTAMFTEPSRYGRLADSVQMSSVSGTSQFRIRVYTRHFLARFWELGWRHWRQKTGTQRVKGRRGKVERRNKYSLTAKTYRRAIWKPILYDNIRLYRKVFRDFVEGRIGRPLTFRD